MDAEVQIYEPENLPPLKATPAGRSAIASLIRLDGKLDRIVKDVTKTKAEIAGVVESLRAEGRLVEPVQPDEWGPAYEGTP